VIFVLVASGAASAPEARPALADRRIFGETPPGFRRDWTGLAPGQSNDRTIDHPPLAFHRQTHDNPPSSLDEERGDTMPNRRPPVAYTTEDLRPPYKLWFTWAGWPDRKIPGEIIESVAPLWDERDGIRLLKQCWDGTSLQLFVSTKPEVAPTLITGRLKGRLWHAMYSAEMPVEFRSNFGLRSVGSNDRRILEKYLDKQVSKEGFADFKFARFMRTLTVEDPTVDLVEAHPTTGGIYWYDLHLVLVTEGREYIRDRKLLTAIRDWTREVATANGHQIASLAVMPDHLHALVRPEPVESPVAASLLYVNEISKKAGFQLWDRHPYMGTFGEYPSRAIHAKAAKYGF
jgi:REP element-mobilizing transposase RayT